MSANLSFQRFCLLNPVVQEVEEIKVLANLLFAWRPAFKAQQADEIRGECACLKPSCMETETSNPSSKESLTVTAAKRCTLLDWESEDCNRMIELEHLRHAVMFIS
jgi:hypothetical protein